MAGTPPAVHDDDAAAPVSPTGDETDVNYISVEGDDAEVCALHQRLEAHASDTAALVHEVTRSAESSDEQELELLLRFLQSQVEPLVAEQVALGLIASVETAFAVQDATSGATLVLLLLLDQLLPGIIKRRGGSSEDTGHHQAKQMLLAFFRLATKRLSYELLEEQERTIFLQWCELVLELVYTESSSDVKTADVSDEDLATNGHHLWIVSIAAMLLALHDAMAQRTAAPTAADLQVVTLVWKVRLAVQHLFKHANHSTDNAMNVCVFAILY